MNKTVRIGVLVPAVLATWLFATMMRADETSGIESYVVCNAGFSGNNSRDLLKKLDQEVLARKPRLVVIMVGTNDMLNSGNALSLDQYRANLEAIAQRLKSTDVKLVLMTPPPCYAPYVVKRHKPEFFRTETPAQKVAAAVGVIREIAIKYALPVVDINTLINRVGNIGTDPGCLLRNKVNSGIEDGVHLTPEGYRVVGIAIYQLIVDLQLPRDHIVCYGDSITKGVGANGIGTTEGETYPAVLSTLLREPLEKSPSK